MFYDELWWTSVCVISVDSHLLHHSYSYQYTKVLGCVTCRVTSNIMGIVHEYNSWGNVKTIRSVKQFIR